MPQTSTTKLTMQDLVDQVGTALIPIKEKSLVEVTILAKSRTKVLVDVQGITLGFIPEKEFSSDIGELQVGDKVLAYVLSQENDDGYVVLSLKRADKERFLTNLQQKFTNQEFLTVRVKQANRGGLMVEYGSLEGFLPASQLASNHYPKVGDNKERIVTELNKLVGQNLKVKILNYDQSANKLVFSEKAAGDSLLEEKIKTLQVGQELAGTVSGIVDFGIFVDIGGLEGLVHISEIAWHKVENIRKMFQMGDKVKVKILSIEANKIYFSMKRLTPDPWLEAAKNYPVGQQVQGKVSKITPFGVLVELDEQIKGLIHISELLAELKKSGQEKIEDLLVLGKEYDFIIKSVDLDNHKINLVLAGQKIEIEKRKEKETKTEKVKGKEKGVGKGEETIKKKKKEKKTATADKPVKTKIKKIKKNSQK